MNIKKLCKNWSQLEKTKTLLEMTIHAIFKNSILNQEFGIRNQDFFVNQPNTYGYFPQKNNKQQKNLEFVVS